jgi:hypothetical protein
MRTPEPDLKNCHHVWNLAYWSTFYPVNKIVIIFNAFFSSKCVAVNGLIVLRNIESEPCYIRQLMVSKCAKWLDVPSYLAPNVSNNHMLAS